MNNLEEYKDNKIGKIQNNNFIDYWFLYRSYDWMDINFNGDYVSSQLKKCDEKGNIIDRVGHHVSYHKIDIF